MSIPSCIENRLGTENRPATENRLVIENRLISDDSDCYVIAELGHNHQGNVETCIELIRAAKEAGASAVKLQKRDNRSLFTREFFNKPYDHENSFGSTYGEHREYLEFGWKEYREVQAAAREIGITFFATAFDLPSCDFLARLDVPAIKIASADLTNTPLLKHAASIGKPLLVSTGGGSMDDVQRAYDLIMPINPQLCIIQCTCGYPCAFEEMNLRVLQTYRQRFPGVPVGLSAHDNGIAMAVLGFALGGGCVIEKHFTLNRAMKGTDHAFSLERPGLAKLVRDLKRARVALGNGVKEPYASEIVPLRKMSKKIVAARDLPAGHVLALGDLAFKSPGDGLPPWHVEYLVDGVTRFPLTADEALSYEKVHVRTDYQAISAPPPSETLETLMSRVRLMVFDFDGVFTDNRVHVMQDGTETVSCNRSDGYGLQKLAKSGIHTAVISSEINGVVSTRCRKLGIRCMQSVEEKLPVLKSLAAELGVGLAEVGYLGNDINDLTCLGAVGVPMVVQDAHPEVIPFARYRTRQLGGKGAVREVCDLLMQAHKSHTHSAPVRAAA